jgi:hypothetical protein
MSGTAEHIVALEDLIFSAEHACKVASNSPVGDPATVKAVQDADTALVKLQTLLGYFSTDSEFEQWHSQPLLRDCLARLARLRVHHNQSSTRYVALLTLKPHFFAPDFNQFEFWTILQARDSLSARHSRRLS